LSTLQLARAVGVDRWQAWLWLSGRVWPSGPAVLRLSRALRRPAGAVLLACEAAVKRRQARLAVEAARKAAESDGE
jgi:hypothetical protein